MTSISNSTPIPIPGVNREVDRRLDVLLDLCSDRRERALFESILENPHAEEMLEMISILGKETIVQLYRSPESILRIIGACIDLPDEAFQLIHEGMDGKERAVVLLALQGVSKRAVEAALYLVVPSMSGDARAALIEALAAIGDSCLDVARESKSLISPTMPIDEVIHILEGIAIHHY